MNSITKYAILVLPSIYLAGCASVEGSGDDTNTPGDDFNGPSLSLADSNFVDGIVFAKSGATYDVADYANIEGNITFGPNVKVVFHSDVNVDGKLTFLEGCVVLLHPEVEIDVDKGQLDVLGTEESPVYFKNAVAGQYWGYGSTHNFSGGLWFSSNANPLSKIRYAVIDSANTGIYVGVDGIEITGTKFTNSQFYGVSFSNDAIGPEAGANFNTFSGNKEGSIHISASMVGRLADSNFFDLSEIGTVVYSGSIADEAIWPAFSKPYLIRNRVQVDDEAGASLTIKAGAQLRFVEDAYLEVSSGGSLDIAGTAEAPVYLGPAEHGKYWGYGSTNTYAGGVWVESGASSNIDIRYAIIDSAKIGARIDVSGASIQNCEFRNNQFKGIHFVEESEPEVLTENSFVNNGEFSFEIGFGALVKIDNSNTFTGANSNIYLHAFDAKTTGTIPAQEVAYHVSEKMKIANPDKAVTITIEAGATFHMEKDAYVDVDENGTLIANGTAVAPIVFDAAVNGTEWGYGSTETNSGGIWLSSNSTTATELSNVILKDVVLGNGIDNDANVPTDQLQVTVE